MALMPASGFQSAQFRFIEIACTDGWLLVEPSRREPENPALSPEEIYELMYWRKGATEEGSGNKTLTLRRFEAKYKADIIGYLNTYRTNNLRQQAHKAGLTTDLREALSELDKLFNLDWRHVHLRSAVRYLHRAPSDIAATGGTNWMRYLPPAEQQTRFFPELGPWLA
jgi:tryptophan 2,3-dioxygenase